jgi:hypothetical protein
MLTIIPGVLARRQVDPRQLGWLRGRRAETRSSFPANRDYVDLRGRTPADLDAQLALEDAAWARLAANNYSPRALDEAEQMQRRSADVPMLDFGIASTVVALSALGCVPVMSCRGRSLGAHTHQYPAPMATFYAREAHVPVLLRAAEQADVFIVNAGAKLEVYSEDLRKMHAFAAALRDAIRARG